MLTAIILIPLLTALALAFVPRALGFAIRLGALAATALSLLLTAVAFLRFDSAATGYQFVLQVPWVESLGLSYHVGADGLNIGLILMGAIVAFAAACVSWDIKERQKEFYILLLVMTGGILGAFASLDLFFFYFFHELALVPTFIMIGVWGRGTERTYAAYQITIYLSIGALLALVGLIALYLQSGANTFSIPELTAHLRSKPMSTTVQNCIFPLLLFGFGILVSLWPFHTWAPLGYGSAPTATAMLHAGVLKKFGLYGLIRIALPMLPAAAQPWMQVVAWLCLGNLLLVGLVAMRQKNLNLLIGNSSVAHMGFAFLGIASLTLIGVTGTVMVMIAHGLLAALTFGLSGWIYANTGTLEMDQMGGLLKRLRFIGTVFIIAAFAGCGLPGFPNFVGEMMTFFGSWQSGALAGPHKFVVLAAYGALIIGAIYMLRAVRQMMHGPLPERWATLSDASMLEKVPYALLLAALLLFGIFPSLLTKQIKPVVAQIVAMVTVKSPAKPGTTVDQTEAEGGAPTSAPQRSSEVPLPEGDRDVTKAGTRTVNATAAAGDGPAIRNPQPAIRN
jgi:NADH-quinone oxidoreductase subunit M